MKHAAEHCRPCQWPELKPLTLQANDSLRNDEAAVRPSAGIFEQQHCACCSAEPTDGTTVRAGDMAKGGWSGAYAKNIPWNNRKYPNGMVSAIAGAPVVCALCKSLVWTDAQGANAAIIG